MEQCGRLTAILPKLNQSPLAPIRKLAADYLRGAVGATVVHQNKLIIRSPGASKTAKLVQQAAHHILLVIDWDDDRIVRFGSGGNRHIHWKLKIIPVSSAMNR